MKNSKERWNYDITYGYGESGLGCTGIDSALISVFGTEFIWGVGSADASTFVSETISGIASATASTLVSGTISGVASAFNTVPPAVASSGLFSVGAGRALSLVEVGRRAFPMS